VAGDDTVLVVVAEGHDAKRFSESLGGLAGLRTTPQEETN
jgi:arginine repressor